MAAQTWSDTFQASPGSAWSGRQVFGQRGPEPDFVGMPRLTVRMCARIQGFSR